MPEKTSQPLQAMSNTIAIPRKLWEHPQPERTDMYKFQKAAEISVGRDFKVSRLNAHLLSKGLLSTTGLQRSVPMVHRAQGRFLALLFPVLPDCVLRHSTTTNS